MKRTQRIRKRRILRGAVGWGMVGLLVTLAVVALYPRVVRARIDSALQEGQYDEASAWIARVWDDSVRESLETTCMYERAKATYQSGDYAAAALQFQALEHVAEAEAWYDASRFRIAETAYAQGDFVTALATYESLTDYPEAESWIGALAVAITGLDDAEDAYAYCSGASAASRAQMARMTQARAALRPDLLAVGAAHTVGRMADGRCVATGANDYGQCGVDDWSDIISIRAGAYHTVGLRADGAVVAVGRNDEGQCNVADWTDIVRIAAGDYTTIGLRADGTIVTCGYHTYDSLRALDGIADIGAGAYGLVVRQAEGQFRASHPSLALEAADPRTFVGFAVSTGYAVGWTREGTVISPALKLNDRWADVVMLSASSTALWGITATGQVIYQGIYAPQPWDFSGDGPAVAIASNATHAAIAYADGTVRTLGCQDHPACRVDEWRLL